MKGALQIAKFFGIPVKIHWTFALLFLWVGWVAHSEGFGQKGVLWLTLFVLALFACVVLHEFGHALTARRFGVQTKDIILLPIGGVARLDKLPEKPWHEFLVAIAGPAVNVVIAGLLAPYFFLYSFSTFQRNLMYGMTMESFSDFIPMLIFLNIVLAIFNLIPAFPMDGGRIFRALLSIRIGRSKATRMASYLGQLLAVLMIVYGLWEGGFTTILIGAFVFMSASQENKMVQNQSLLDGHTVAEIMQTEFTVFRLEDPVFMAIERVKRGGAKNFLVLDEYNKIAGVLKGSDLISAMKTKDLYAPAIDYLSPIPNIAARTSDPLDVTLGRIQGLDSNILPVVSENNQLLGTIDLDGIHRFLHIQQQLKK